MTELIRDTVFGHLVRLVTHNKYLQYEEEKDPSLLRRYIDVEKSGNVAHHSHAGPPGEDSDDEPLRTKSRDERQSDASSRTRVPDDGYQYNEASGVRIDPEKGRDIHVVSWWGPNDPENPQNWSLPKKFFVTFEICLLTFSIYIGSAIYSAGEMSVEKTFGVSQVAATLGLTLFVAGYGIGPMIWSPMSEIPMIGRNPVYIGTLIIFVIFQVPTALSVNFGMLLAFRFLTGFFGSPALATGGASIGDMYKPSKRAYGMAIWGISAVCGPTMGPLVGGFAAQAEDWTWTIWELMWLSGFCLVFLVFFLPETSSANILYRRTRRLRKLTGDERLKCEPEIMAENMSGKDVIMMSLVRPLTLNFTEPMVFILNLYIGLVYALLYCWIESFFIVFVEIYHFNLGEEGLSFLGILIGAILVLPPFFAYLYFIQEKQFNENGEIQPEKRLPAACVGAFFIPICLFWFGWSAGRTHWIVPIVGSAWFAVGTVLLFNSVLNYLADAYPDHAASVLAGNDFMRSAFGAGFPLFATAMYKTLGVGWASSLLGFLAVAFIPIPFALWFYGERLRKMSKHARKDF
ncbi:uncharacterized protein K452DRAFT_356083 [Aplosporella prunicola CBS 121167]|uniref:Major facilitator superfamily (MFS) profile domain-containing protein n=1 Tax=Aplosporella prunicola CBS 121167 TaxID=1176127 RepID=A0A6A6BNH3_9PEZI|nr:uncharacterized protein K452DRAFT_356083 [Aplosporella prunicola CBS 121167]KAF2145680.1 hypothetical protein K452DRAFT_356083 [Aplosporella prunicola CBS 121167]